MADRSGEHETAAAESPAHGLSGSRFFVGHISPSERNFAAACCMWVAGLQVLLNRLTATARRVVNAQHQVKLNRIELN
jgi:hypothetical protein